MAAPLHEFITGNAGNSRCQQHATRLCSNTERKLVLGLENYDCGMRIDHLSGSFFEIISCFSQNSSEIASASCSRVIIFTEGYRLDSLAPKCVVEARSWLNLFSGMTSLAVRINLHYFLDISSLVLHMAVYF
jgi:hypothetical protein